MMTDTSYIRTPRSRFPSPGLSPTTWGRLTGDLIPSYADIVSPLPSYVEQAPSLTQTYFDTPQFEGRAIPSHIREKTISRFIHLLLSLLAFSEIVENLLGKNNIPVTLMWAHLISIYLLIATHVLDDSSTGVAAKAYRYTHLVFETSASLQWMLLSVISFSSPLRDKLSGSLVVLTALIVLIWFASLFHSVWTIKYNNAETTDEGTFNTIVFRNDGRVSPREDFITWLAQPRNKARSLLSILYLLICASPQKISGYFGSTYRIWAAISLGLCIFFVSDKIWRNRIQLKWRVLLEFLYDFGYILFFISFNSSSYDNSTFIGGVEFFQWSALLLHLYVLGWNMHRYYIKTTLPKWLTSLLEQLKKSYIGRLFYSETEVPPEEGNEEQERLMIDE